MSLEDKAEPAAEEQLHEDGLLGHLTDLRNSVVKATLAVAVAFIALFPFSDQIYTRFAAPLIAELPEGSQLIATGVIAPFLVPLKVIILVAFCITLPYVLYQVWSFIAPGLYRRERHLITPLVISSTLLFYLGMLFAYFLVFRVVFGFIVAFAPEAISVMPDVQSHLSFAITIFLTFGLAFEVPVAVFILVQTGVLELAGLRKARTFVIAGAFIVAAIITPPDVLSQFLLAVPVWLLYEVGIIAAALLPPREQVSKEDDNDTTGTDAKTKTKTPTKETKQSTDV